MHAKQDRRKSLRLHTPTPELSPLVTIERKNRSSAAHSSPETKDTSADFTQPKKNVPTSDSDAIAAKSPMSRKRKRHHSLANAKRMKRSSVESHTVSVTRINTPIYEEASVINFFSFSPESDDYPPSKVMLSSAASSSPEKHNSPIEEPSASKEFPSDVDTIPETPLIAETAPKLKKREFRVSLSLNPEAIEKGVSGKSRLKSPLLFGAVPSWDDIISPKSSEKSPSIASSPGSVLQKTAETVKETEHMPFLASPLPSTSKNISQAKKVADVETSDTKQKSESISPPPSVDIAKSCTVDESSPVEKFVSTTLASPVNVGEMKLLASPIQTDVPPERDETASPKPDSPAIPVDIGIPEPESASPPTPMDVASPDALTTSVFSTLTHPSAITETIVVTSSTLMGGDVSETKKPLSPVCSTSESDVDGRSANSQPSTTATTTIGATDSSSYSTLSCEMDVGVTGKAKTRPSTLTTNPVAISSSLKISQPTSTQPTPKSITSTINSKPVLSDSRTSLPVHKKKSAGHEKSPEINSQLPKRSSSERTNSSPNGQPQGAAKVSTTPPGKPQSPTTNVSKQELEQSPRNKSPRNGDDANEKTIEASPPSQQINPGPSGEEKSLTTVSVVKGVSTGAPTPVITAPPQVGSQPHHKQLVKTDRESTPKTAEIKPPVLPQPDPTAETGLSQRLEGIIIKEPNSCIYK